MDARDRRTEDRDRAMLAEALPVLREVDEAERQGDAGGALDLIEADIARRSGDDRFDFWRPERIHRLLQLRLYDAVLPGWVTSRWLLAQALQWLDPRSRPLVRKSLDVALATRGPIVTRWAGDEVDAQCKVIDHDWIFRQVFLYELGGFETFLRRSASPHLVAGADRPHEWARARMGGYRLLASTSLALTWQDLSTGKDFAIDNLGAASLVGPGECVIGRVVPVDGGSMFETAPLVVPEAVARSVAADPGGWIDELASACRRPQDPELPIRTDLGHDYGLVTDVPTVVSDILAAHASEWIGPGARADIDRGRLGRPGELALLRVALDGELDALGDEIELDAWPAVGALLLDPRVTLHLARSGLCTDAAPLGRLAECLPRPAADVCRDLASELRAA